MVELTKLKDENGEEMSEIKPCPGCNKRKRRLYEWFDEQAGGNIILCEDCIFLREFEKQLVSDFADEDNVKVLIDYEAFGYMKQAAFPYQWLEYYILTAYFKNQAFLRLDKLTEDWPYKSMELEKIISHLVSWNILTTPDEKEIDGTIVKIVKFGSLLEGLMKSTLEKVKSTGMALNMGSILKIIEGRMGFGIETKNTFKDHIRSKLMTLALKYGYNSDGTMKPEVKVTKTIHYRCKVCGEVRDFHFALANHILEKHPEVPDDKKDENVEQVTQMVGIKIPRSDIAKLDEMVTYGNRFMKILTELFKKDAFFVNTAEVSSEEDTVTIAAPWANVMEKVNIKVKELLKSKEKIKTT